MKRAIVFHKGAATGQDVRLPRHLFMLTPADTPHTQKTKQIEANTQIRKTWWWTNFQAIHPCFSITAASQRVCANQIACAMPTLRSDIDAQARTPAGFFRTRRVQHQCIANLKVSESESTWRMPESDVDSVRAAAHGTRRGESATTKSRLGKIGLRTQRNNT